MATPKPQVAVLHTPAASGTSATEFEPIGSAQTVIFALNSCGFEARSIAVNPPYRQLMRGLAYPVPDLVINLTGGDSASPRSHEPQVTALLDLLKLPHTGGASSSHSLCLGKGRVKALLQGVGLATAPFVVLDKDDPIPDPSLWLGLVIIKPDSPTDSLDPGLESWCVVDQPEDLAERVERMRRSRPGRILIESFLPGREFWIGIAACPMPQALIPAEVDFESNADRRPILNRRAKRKPGSAEDRRAPIRCPTRLDAELAQHLKDLAVTAFRACDCRDYAMLGFRLDADGQPMILEIDPNPRIDPSSIWARALRATGRGYRETLRTIAACAMQRGAESS